MIVMSAEELRMKGQGKGAVFMNAFLSFLSEGDEMPLSETQRAGIDWVEEQGGTISLQYMKVCCRYLQAAGLIEYVRNGRGWRVRMTDVGVEWYNSLPDDWGTDPTTPSETINDSVRAEVAKKPNRRVKAGTRLPANLWRAYVAAQQAGELDIIFVKAGSQVQVRRAE